MVINNPVIDVGTESYSDNQLILWLMKMQMDMRNADLTHVFVVGDEQTYERLIHMKENQRFGYDWMIPFPGEFHFAGHMIECDLKTSFALTQNTVKKGHLGSVRVRMAAIEHNEVNFRAELPGEIRLTPLREIRKVERRPCFRLPE